MVRPPTVFRTRRDRYRTVALLVGVAAVALVAGSLLVRRFPFLADPARLRAWLLGFGPLAPLAFVGVQILQVVVAPVPGQVLGFASGYLFGAFWGTVYSMVGVTVGTALAVGLSRHFGRPYVERVVDAETLAAFDDLTADHGLAVLFVVFLVPGLPDDSVCFVAGLTDVPVGRIVAVAALGRLPGFLLVNVAGSAAANDEGLLAAAVVALLASVSVLGYLYRGRILAAVTDRTPGR